MIARLHALSAHQTVRFLALGGLAAAINWLVRFPLSAVMPLGAAVFLAYLIGMSAGFTLYRKYVFPGSDRPLLQQTLIFLAVNLVGAAVVLGFTFVLVAAQADLAYADFIKIGLAHGLAIAIGAVVNFVGHKTLTFSMRRKSAALAGS
jgi:putative flippase GtrA